MDLIEGAVGLGLVDQKLAPPRREQQPDEPSSRLLQLAGRTLLTFVDCSGVKRGPDWPLVVVVLR